MVQFNKCLTVNCLFKQHSNINHNGGIYCCTGCMNLTNHGPLCEKIIYDSTHTPTLDICFRREVIIDTWEVD